MTIWAFVLALLGLQGLPQTPSASVSGVVLKLGTNEPIPGAYVELSKYEVFTAGPPPQPAPPPNPKEPPSVFNATTGTDGRFVFRDLPDGRYRLVATRTGSSFIPVEYGQRDPRGRGVPIVIAAGQRIENIELVMAQSASINGRVFDVDGEPVGNARVMALEPRYRNGRRVLNIVQAVRSNDLGEYRLFWLRPGRYYVAVKREDQRNFSFSVHVASPEAFGFREDASSPTVTERKLDDGTLVEETDVLVYFGGGTDEQKAQAIDLYAGANISAVDIPAGEGRVRTRRVKGMLLNATIGQPGDALVRLIPRNSPAHSIIPNTRAEKDGSFILSGVVPGSYYLSATVGAGRGFSFTESFIDIRSGTNGLVPIEVGERDLEGVAVLMRPAFSMAGRIYVETASKGGGFDVANARISLMRNPDLLGLPQPRIRIGAPGQAADGSPSQDGGFTLSGFGTGEYRVSINGIPQSAYVKAIRYGTSDVLNGGLKIENTPDGELAILVNLDGSTLEGRTLNEKSEPVVNAMVVLVPDAPARGMHHLYKTDSSDSSGRFEIKGIAPGDYKAFAFEYIDREAWLNPEFLQAFESRGTSVRVSEGSKQQLQLTVVPPAR